MKYSYTAVITPTEDGTEYYCKVPDLPGCVTTGSDVNECIDLISDAMALWLVSAEDHDDPIPAATRQSEIPRSDDSVLSVIRADTLAYRALTDTKAVRKNVSLPAWMATLADKRGINCSQVLQEGLRQALGG
jgi:predicted RNase H-like HicB family nuclease